MQSRMAPHSKRMGLAAIPLCIGFFARLSTSDYFTPRQT
jgi:hypothetical protein